jgi:acylphosphatase
MTNTMSVRIRVVGKVQGVGFRAWCVHTAHRLGVQGWVRNRSDGSVEVLATGTEPMINKLITAVHTGPAHAKVEEVSFSAVDARDPDLAGLQTGFHQIDTPRRGGSA